MKHSNQSNEINPALKDLDVLTGPWTMELSNASFLPDRSTIIQGETSFEWFESDFFIMRQGLKASGIGWATWFIGRDEASTNYTVLYNDDRRVSRVYEMSFANGVWRIWRNDLKLSQRFEAKVSKDKIVGHWEKSIDGKPWEHDFDLAFEKRTDH